MAKSKEHDPLSPSSSCLMVLDLALELRRRAKAFASAGDAERATSLYASCNEQLQHAEGQIRVGHPLRKLIEKVLEAWHKTEEQEFGDKAELIERKKELGRAAAELEVAVAEALEGSGISTTTPSGTDQMSDTNLSPRNGGVLTSEASNIAEEDRRPLISLPAENGTGERSPLSSASSSSSSRSRTRIPWNATVLFERVAIKLSEEASDPRTALQILGLPENWPTELKISEVRQRFKEAACGVSPRARGRLKAAYSDLRAAMKEPSRNAAQGLAPSSQALQLPMDPLATAANGAICSQVSLGLEFQPSPMQRPRIPKKMSLGGRLLRCLIPNAGRRRYKGEMTIGPAKGGSSQLRLARDFQRGAMLGAGSFGCVFAARHVSTGEIVAVKEMFLDRGSVSNEARGARLVRLTRELRLCEQLEHPRIVRYMGHEFVIGAQGGPERVYLFLEYCSGGSLAAQLRTFGALNELLLRKYTAQLVEGLIYLHSRSPPVVHRDLKCANLLLTHGADVKITDFGCSKWLSGSDAVLEAEHSVVGSVFWMAPELLRGKPRLATCSDV